MPWCVLATIANCVEAYSDGPPDSQIHVAISMHDDPNQFLKNTQYALERISNTPKTLYWAPKMRIIDNGQLYEALKIDEQRTSMTGKP